MGGIRATRGQGEELDKRAGWWVKENIKGTAEGQERRVEGKYGEKEVSNYNTEPLGRSCPRKSGDGLEPRLCYKVAVTLPLVS